jgi:hypothetical protein
MTRTFSLSKNAGLNKATQSFQQLAGVMQSALLASALTSSSRRPSAQATVSRLRAAGMRAAYKVSGVADMGGARLVYDDKTGEVSAIEAPNAKVTFDFVNHGATRSWDALIVKSPDGTTGRFHVEVTGGWKAMPSLGAYKWLANEVPETVETAAFTLEIVPKGDASLAFKMAGTFDEPQAVPKSAQRVPTHWRYNAQIPKLSFDWESRLNLAAGQSAFAGEGHMTVEADNGPEQFTLAAKAVEQDRFGVFSITNTAAKVSLVLNVSQPDPHRQPSLATTLVSAEDGSKLGDVALDPARPRFAIVTFTDGTRMDWELYPESLLPNPGAIAPPPPDAFDDNG